MCYPRLVVLNSSITSQVTRKSMGTGSIICLTSWSTLWYFIFPTSSSFGICCMKPTISTVCCRLYDWYSLTPCHTLLIFVALVTLRVTAKPRGCWSGSALGFCSLPTSYWVDTVREKSLEVLSIYIRWQLWQDVCELLMLGTLNSTNLNYLSHWLACIPLEQDGLVPKMCYN